MSWFGKSPNEKSWETHERQQEESRLQLEESNRQLEASRRQLEDYDRQQETVLRQTEVSERQLSESNRLLAESAKIKVIELQNAERASRILDNAESLMIRFGSCLTQMESRLSSLDNTSGKPNG